MSNLTINIVAFDIPFPADYGGTIDIFYKIKALHNLGVNILLHCFEYNKSPHPELDKYCKKVYYYHRKSGIRYLLSSLPYIVVTRKNKQLLQNLQENNFPILFEGLHTCYYINHSTLQKRQKIIRMHNIEHHYYKGLKNASTNIFKKVFFYFEGKKLSKYESIINYASTVAAISPEDYKYLAEKHSGVKLISAFHPFEKISSKPGKGKYFLYHGNLDVEENKNAITFLLDKIFNKVDVKLIIAGKNSSKQLVDRILQLPNVELIANPSATEMDSLIENAHCSVLPTFQSTGLKLKLLISLFSGRHVITNSAMVKNTELETLCQIADEPKDFIEKINLINGIRFAKDDIDKRKNTLEKFTNTNNSKKLIKLFEV